MAERNQLGGPFCAAMTPATRGDAEHVALLYLGVTIAEGWRRASGSRQSLGEAIASSACPRRPPCAPRRESSDVGEFVRHGHECGDAGRRSRPPSRAAGSRSGGELLGRSTTSIGAGGAAASLVVSSLAADRARRAAATVSASSVSLNFPRAPSRPGSARRARGARGRRRSAASRNRAPDRARPSQASRSSRRPGAPAAARTVVSSAGSARQIESGRDCLVGEEARISASVRAARREGNHTGANGRKQSARFARRENDRGVGRGLLEKLEERVRRLVGAFLRHHALGVADDEHFPPRHRRLDMPPSERSSGSSR